MLCHEDHGEVRGWVLDVGGDAPVEALPVPYNLFHGVTLVRCDASEAEALALMQAGDATRQALSDVARTMACVPVEEQASWERCRPCRVPSSLFTARRDREGNVTFEDGGHVAILDGAEWTPELSPDGFVGLYFLWSSSGSRLELYAACQSYLPLACAEFARMVFRLRGRCLARFVAQSEEAQWLRMACARNRARLLAKVCEAVGVRAPTINDYCGNSDRSPIMAMIHCETLHHDLLPLRDGRVRMLNYCACGANERETACCMAPWEGVWLVRAEDAFCPTAAPRLGARVRPFSFTSAPPRDSRVLCVHDWAASVDDESDNPNHNNNEADALLSLMELNTRDGLRSAPRRTTTTTTTTAAAAEAAARSEEEGRHNTKMKPVKKEEEEANDVDMIRAAYRRSLRLHPPQSPEGATTNMMMTSSSTEQPTQYLMFDEPVVRRMGWSREVVKLLPFGVVTWRPPSSSAI